MKIDNPFDQALDRKKYMPESMRTASTFVTDTLELAWLAAQSVFEQHARPEHAIALLPFFIERADAERQQRLSYARDRTTDES